METIIKKLAENIESNLIHDMHNEQNGDDITMLVLAAYNRYQEDERDGSEYISNLNNKEDLKCCIIDGGMSIDELASLYYNHKEHKCTAYFLFGRNYEQPDAFASMDALKNFLGNFLHSIVMHMLAHQDVDGYKQLYNLCISDYMINNNLV